MTRPVTAAKVQPMPTLAEKVAADELGALRTIPPELLRIASWNARKSFDPIALAELTESMRQHGVQVPLLVRPYPESEWHRLDQGETIGGVVDNLQREDVPALEEADAYAELQQRLGTAAASAARVGKDVAYVTKRLQLIALAEYPRKALAERLITIDHALLLARLGVEEQDVNLKWALNTNAGVKEKVAETIAYRIKDRDKDDRYGYWQPQSVLNLKNHIEQNVGRKLKRAPWDLKDAELVAAAG